MPRARGQTGFPPLTGDAERRAFFEQMRRNGAAGDALAAEEVARTAADAVLTAAIAARVPTYYYATTVARDAAPAPTVIGTIAVVGTATGTTTAMPRRYMWNGTAWVFDSHWAPAGRPGVTLSQGAFSTANGATTFVPWTTEANDFDGWHAGTSDILTVPTGWGGRYVVCYQHVMGTGTTIASIACYVNGSPVHHAYATTAFSVSNLTFSGNLPAATTLRFAVYQTSGVAQNVTPTLSIDWLGP